MPDTVTEYISGIPMERRPWYDDPHSIAELYEWLARDGSQPLAVSTFIRNAQQWEAQYLHMRSWQKRNVSLEQLQACRDARMGTVAPKDDQGGTDAQSAA